MQDEMKAHGQTISPSKMCQIFGKTLKIKIACDEEITNFGDCSLPFSPESSF